MMKCNRWTLALAAAGLVTLPSLLCADEQKPSSVLTALSATTISGYVDASAQWNLGTGNANNPPYSFGGANKADGFNLNVVDLALDKPQDDSQWAAGYHVELWFGPDANLTTGLGSQSAQASDDSGDFAIRQAYVALRTPIGNGINWKIGVFDTIIGYEGLSSPGNPNYTHSYGFTIEPTTHTGVLGTYQVNDQVAVSAGIANTIGPSINARAFPTKAESSKTYMASVTYTCPTNCGWASGSTVTAGVVNGYSGSYGDNTANYYVGATLATPLSTLKVGAAFDYLDIHNWNKSINGNDGDVWVAGLYGSFQATEKLALNVRGEYVHDEAFFFAPFAGTEEKFWEMTATAQYDLWKNVISRVEIRWDHSGNAVETFGGTGSPNRDNAYMLAANIIYKF